MIRFLNVLAAFSFGVGALLGSIESSAAQQNPVTAIDVALEPDATMIQHAKANNARLLKVYPGGFALDATHNPHITLLQQFVPTSDIDRVYAALDKALVGEHPTQWKLKAFKYYYIPMPPVGVAGIVIAPTGDLHRLQQKMIDAVVPFAVKSGTAAAFASTDGGRDIQAPLIDYVANFVAIGSGQKFNPHVTTGVAAEACLKEMLAEPFEAFTFSPASTSIYQLGTFGTARKELKVLVAKP
jgi:2'-5' RNA ligase